MNAKEYLSQVWKLNAMIDNLMIQKAELHDTMYSIGLSTGIGDGIRGSSDPDKYGKMMGQIDAMERRINKKIVKFSKLRLKISEEINNIDNDKYINILFHRYIRQASLETIAVRMDFSYQHIRHAHGWALQEFAKTNKFLKLDTK